MSGNDSEVCEAQIDSHCKPKRSRLFLRRSAVASTPLPSHSYNGRFAASRQSVRKRHGQLENNLGGSTHNLRGGAVFQPEQNEVFHLESDVDTEVRGQGV